MSCSKQHEVKLKNRKYIINDFEFELRNRRIIPWKVGAKKNKIISQGFMIEALAPGLTTDSKEILFKEFGIDSWVYRMIPKGKSHLPLGYLFYEFKYVKSRETTVYMKLYYHAAITSSFRSLVCPLFKHRKLINELIVSDNTQSNKRLVVKAGVKYRGRVEKVSFLPIVFSGGQGLEGKYEIQIALYNSSKKTIHSNWYSASEYITVANESKVYLKSCAGVKSKSKINKSQSYDIRNMEIK